MPPARTSSTSLTPHSVCSTPSCPSSQKKSGTPSTTAILRLSPSRLPPIPESSEAQIDLAAETDMSILQDLIVSVRNLRAELKVEPKVRVPIEVFANDPAVRTLIEENRGAVERLGSVESLKFVDSSLASSAGARSTARFDVFVLYEKKIDVAAERDRLNKDLEKIEKEIANGQRQLSNEQFLAKAPAKVVEGIRTRAEELKVLRDKTVASLKELA